MNIAIFASGQGSNFLAIIKAFKKRKTDGKIALLVCDNPQAEVISRAKRIGIKTALVQRENFSSRKDFEKEITGNLKNNNIELIVLAGFMRLLSPEFVKLYAGRIINIHPSLLPAFKGEHGIRDAFDYGAKITGVTVHFVDEKMDHGPIILQGIVEIKERDTLESLESKIHKLEHKLYPRAIRLFQAGKLRVSGRKTQIAIQ
ncbi:MAG: phosphoribosylglycinamide formyltransferase [Candidatus Omnitrophota bacterium]